MENNATCRDHPTMVSKPYYRVDLFNRQMTDVLLTSLLVTTIENKTVAHIGTSTGRLLQVYNKTRGWGEIFLTVLITCFFFCLFAACVDKIKSYNLCQLLFGWEPEDLIYCCCELIRVSTFRSWRQGTVAITCLWKKEYEYFWANVLKCFRG